jgi:hypothetical protein
VNFIPINLLGINYEFAATSCSIEGSICCEKFHPIRTPHSHHIYTQNLFSLLVKFIHANAFDSLQFCGSHYSHRRRERAAATPPPNRPTHTGGESRERERISHGIGNIPHFINNIYRASSSEQAVAAAQERYLIKFPSPWPHSHQSK